MCALTYDLELKLHPDLKNLSQRQSFPRMRESSPLKIKWLKILTYITISYLCNFKERLLAGWIPASAGMTIQSEAFPTFLPSTGVPVKVRS
jgi:hypothetical protein